MTITLRDIRLSFVWTQTILPDDVPALGSQLGYANVFEEAQGEASTTLELPWQGSRRHHFWRYYMGLRRAGAVAELTAQSAWERVMPFRTKRKMKLDPGTDTDRIMAEAFASPVGVGAVITMRLRGDLPLTDGVDQAIAAARRWYTGTWTDGRPNPGFAPRPIEESAVELLDAVRREHWAPPYPPASSTDGPFTVLTVVDASGAEPGVAVQSGRELHTAIEGLCLQDPNWRTNQMPALTERTSDLGLQPRRAPVGHLLYGTPNRRVVWYPVYFSEHLPDRKKKRVQLLSCHHRNLTLSALVTQGLTGAAAGCAARLAASGQLPAWLEGPAENGVRTLGRLYGGAATTYRTSSVRAQLGPRISVVDQVRDHFGLTPLH